MAEAAEASEQVTRKIIFRGTPGELAELLLVLAEHDIAVLDVDVP